MITICFVVLVALFGTAYSRNCISSSQTDNLTGEVTVCPKDCCGEQCCPDFKVLWKDITEAAVRTANRAYMFWVVVNVFLNVATIGIIVAIVNCCYFYWRKRQLTGIVIRPQEAGASVHQMKMYSGYDQAPSRSPPRDVEKQNVMYNRLPDNDA